MIQIQRQSIRKLNQAKIENFTKYIIKYNLTNILYLLYNSPNILYNVIYQIYYI